jgi:hypothetical protein
MAAGQQTLRGNLVESGSMMVVAAMIATIRMPPIATIATTDRDNTPGGGQ